MMNYHINHHLQKFCGETPEIVGCAVIDIEGVITASALTRKVDEDLIGGMSSTMLGVGERISSELMDSELEQVYVRSPNGYVILNSVGDQALLLVLATKRAKLGLVFMEIQRTVQELEKAIKVNQWLS
ncbi:MAG: roadblock/LC7 domain-containing protein [Methylomicrobium sp.]|jgi:predicted regulator of Ras-like GTPase activity (Roadblock/LC7/MglB family)